MSRPTEHHRKGCRAVLMELAGGEWLNLRFLSCATALSQTGCSARIRDLRKRPWNLTVYAKPSPLPGPWLYRVDPKSAVRALQAIK